MENQGFQCFMLWVTFSYAVGVSILFMWCGQHTCCGKYAVDNMFICCVQHGLCRGYMPWRTTYAVDDMPWRTMSMLPTPYTYGVENTYRVDDMLYAVEAYSVGDILWV